MHDGAVIRSPADPSPVGGARATLAAWPWDEASHHAPTVHARPVATDDLYRPDEDPPAEPQGQVVIPAGTSEVTLPAPAPFTDPFALRASEGLSPRDNAGMKTWGVVLIDVCATTLAATIDMYVNLHLTWITGAVFVLACVVTAIGVRPSDLSIAVITPPLAFVFSAAIAAVTASFGEPGSMLLRLGRDIFTALAFNAPFVFGGTGLALIIVAIRGLRRRPT